MNTRVYVVIALFVGAIAAPGAAQDNLVRNSGFEDPPTPTGMPGLAVNWYPYASGPPVDYFIMGYAAYPWAIYEESQSQMWYAGMPGTGGIYQQVPGTMPGETYQFSAYVADPQPVGPTMVRVGVDPTGANPPNPGDIIWSEPRTVEVEWQQASVSATAITGAMTVVIEAAAMGPSSWRLIADNTSLVLVLPCSKIPNVPDASQPPNNPLGVANVTNWCSPMAAVNVTWYWDKVVANPPAPGVNDNWVINTSAAYVGWWMDTNNLGCANRANGTTYAVANGTYVADISPGILDFARWDSTHAQGAAPPAVPASKIGYDWKGSTKHNLTPFYSANQAWNELMGEINQSRPLIVTWSYWNPVLTFTDPATGVGYCTWGALQNGSTDPSEQWNHAENPDPNYGGTPYGDATIGHSTTVVGYCTNYDPDGAGGLAQTNWAIVHDNWTVTPVDIAIPWRTANGWSPWVANTYIRPKGNLIVSAGPLHPANHWSVANKANVMAQVRLTAGQAEAVNVTSLTLTASGSGNDLNDIAANGVAIWEDVNSNGVVDVGTDKQLASGSYPIDNGTLMLNMPGVGYTVPAGGNKDLLVVYTIKAGVAARKIFRFSLSAMAAKGKTTNYTIVPSGLPFASAMKNIVAGPGVLIPNVPDENQPPTNSLGFPNVNGWCAPTASVNITQYWDKVYGEPRAESVNANMIMKTAADYIGWWMDTGNFGCPFRFNGTTRPAAGGTYVADESPGLAQYARWDAANTFGLPAPPNPALPAGKNGYSWTVFTKHDLTAGYNAALAWPDVVNEIDAGRPMLVSWRYWNLNQLVATVDGVSYYTWGPPVAASAAPNPVENWNNSSDPNGKGGGTIGHCTTAVGYTPNYDPTGGINPTNWVVVHDNWSTTPADIAVQWIDQNANPKVSHWAASTFARLSPPAVGSLTVTSSGLYFSKMYTFAGATVCMANFILTTGPTENVAVNVVKMTASGSGNDQTQITSVGLYDDTNGNGKFDMGTDIQIASGVYPSDNGTLYLTIPGPSGFVVNANASRRILVVYTLSNQAPTGASYKCTIPTLYATGVTSFLPVSVGGSALPFTSSNLIIGIIIPPPPPPHPGGGIIGWWKQQPDGVFCTITGAVAPVVSSGIVGGSPRLGDRIYVESPDRSSGIQMNFGGMTVPLGTLPEGCLLEFEAFIDTIDGERALVQPNILGVGTGLPPYPLGLTNKSLGGGGGGGGGVGQQGVIDGIGLNNIGLLVRAWGTPTIISPTTLELADGSGSPVKCILPSGVGLSPEARFVCISGISSCEQTEEGLRPVIRVRAQDDITPIY